MIMESKFTGTKKNAGRTELLATLLTIVTLGIGYPWAACMRERWSAQHTFIDGKQLVFDGKGGELFGKYIKWFLLTIITLGFYYPTVSFKLKAWIVSHTHFAPVAEAPVVEAAPVEAAPAEEAVAQ